MKKFILILMLPLCYTAVSAQQARRPSANLTPEEKVLGLSRLWQEVNYNFVYRDRMDSRAWDSLYLALIPQVRESADDYEYFRLLEKLCALTNDSHTYICRRPVDPDNPDVLVLPIVYNNFGKYQIWLEAIEGKPVVSVINSDKADEIPPGSEVITVNGLPVKKYLEQNVMPYISASTGHARFNESVYDLFKGMAGQRFEVSFRKPSGEVTDISLTLKDSTSSGKYAELPLMSGEWSMFDLKWMSDGIACIALNSFSDPEIVDMFMEKLPELRSAKGVIMDIRDNGGGSGEIGATILQYFSQGDYLVGARSRTRMHIPYHKAAAGSIDPNNVPQDSLSQLYDKARRDEIYLEMGTDTFRIAPSPAERIIVPTVILTGNNTVSAAEDFLVLADGQKHIIRIGEVTLGSTGQPLTVRLAGEVSVAICSKEDMFPDGRRFVGKGIEPHIEASVSLEDHLKGKDTVLETAVEYIKSKLK